ncbi:MAG: hypothetical protein D6813_04725 [Calditrichaeota bacterium]|nr:MAG: hypothetical protein D6813_04725 [Calditrichota bacterium]
MIRNMGFDEIHSYSMTRVSDFKTGFPFQPSVVLIDGSSNQITLIRDMLQRLFSPSVKSIPVILLLTSRELKSKFLNEFHPYVASVIFKPVSPRLLHHQLQRFLKMD